MSHLKQDAVISQVVNSMVSALGPVAHVGHIAHEIPSWRPTPTTGGVAATRHPS